MSSINSVSGSSTSSIYGNRNIFSGLASGLDTESMIENSISGYKQKINSLIQKQTKLTWKQDAYRNITDQIIDITKKYTSYTSKTNLSSNAFFNNAVNTTGSGKNADKIAASGRTSSQVTVNGVRQLASAAKYKINAGKIMNAADSTLVDAPRGAALNAGGIDWSGKMETSNMAGSLTLTYGNRKIDLSFTTSDVYKDADSLLQGIKDKLSEAYISVNGNNVTADKRIDVKLENGKIVFSDAANAGNSVYISGVSGTIEDTLGIKKGADDGKSFTVPSDKELYNETPLAKFMSEKKVSVSFNGTTKNVSFGDLSEITVGDKKKKLEELDFSKEEDQKAFTEQVATNLNESLRKAFGDGAVEAGVNKREVTDEDGNKKTLYGLSFNIGDAYKENSTLSVSSDYNKELGFGEGGISNYLNTKSTLEELFGKTLEDGNFKKAVSKDIADGKELTEHKDAEGNIDYYLDSKQNHVDKDGNLLDKDGNYLYKMEINGTVVGNFSKKNTLNDVIEAVNASDAGVSINFSKLSNSLVFTGTQSGSGSKIDIREGSLAAAMFGATTDKNGRLYSDIGSNENTFEGAAYTMGSDAVLNVTVNGENLDLVRSSNEIDIDGLTLTLKDTFNDGDDVNFKTGENVNDVVELTSKADADSIIETIKTFVEDVNKLLKDTHDAYSTEPLGIKKNSRSYEPLTEDDKEGMSDSEIERYEEKAKTGLLFGDSNLSSLYSKLRSAITPGGELGATLRHIGISTTYEDGVTSLSIDEDKLRSALDTDPDQVRDAFTKSIDAGSSSNGLMASLKKTMDTYASTSITSPGILVRQAGTRKSALSLSDNLVQDQINNLDDQIDRWQDKMSDKIDYYTRQFTALEQLMSQMNSQSSMLSGMMGGY